MKDQNQTNELKEFLQNLLTASSYFLYVRNKSKENTNLGGENQIVDVAYGSVKEALGLMLKTIRAAAYQQGIRPELNVNKAKAELQKKLEDAKTKSEEYVARLKELMNATKFNESQFSQTIRESGNKEKNVKLNVIF